MDDDFEEGKPMEEYDPNLVKELDSLNIDPEPNPQAEQRLETVAEPPMRNEKKKQQMPKEETTKPPKPELPSAIKLPQEQKPATPVEPVEITPAPAAPFAEKPVSTATQTPVEKIQTPQEQPRQPEAPTFRGIDDYIIQTGKAIGQQAEKNFINNSYQNLLGIISGEYVIVPRQQVAEQKPIVEQPPAQAQPQITKEDLRIVVEEVVDKKLSASPSTQPTQASPVASPKPLKQKQKHVWSKKEAIALTGIFIFFEIIIVLSVGYLLH
jgi:hypothetical protein